MKNLIRTILKETIDNRIVDILIKLNLPNYGEIEEFLKETGYDYNEIDEIYYSYFKTISGLDLTPSNWMNYYYSPDQLEVVKYTVKEKTFFFKKDGRIVMAQEKKDKKFWFDNKEIWICLENTFNMNSEEIRKFLSKWVEDNFKLKGYIMDSIDINWFQY